MHTSSFGFSGSPNVRFVLCQVGDQDPPQGKAEAIVGTGDAIALPLK